MNRFITITESEAYGAKCLQLHDEWNPYFMNGETEAVTSGLSQKSSWQSLLLFLPSKAFSLLLHLMDFSLPRAWIKKTSPLSSHTQS